MCRKEEPETFGQNASQASGLGVVTNLCGAFFLHNSTRHTDLQGVCQKEVRQWLEGLYIDPQSLAALYPRHPQQGGHAKRFQNAWGRGLETRGL